MTTTRRRSVPLATLGTAGAGAAGWLADMLCLWVLDVVVGAPTAVAAAVGFVVSGVVNFAINRRVHGGGSRGDAFRYLALFVANLIVVTLVVPPLASLLSGVFDDRSWQLVAAKAIVTVALLLVNTACYRTWVFRPSDTLRPTRGER